jgi:hypothetical protein
VAEGHVPESLLPIRHGLDFAALKDLVEYLNGLRDYDDASLDYFRYGEGGFAHTVKPGTEPDRTSKASTATCIAYLHAVGKLDPAHPDNQGPNAKWSELTQLELRRGLVNTNDGKWTSADLPKRNPFTVSFLLEAIHVLGARELDSTEEKIVQENADELNRKLKKMGGLGISSFPATSFLTHKAVKSLRLGERLTPDAREAASEWSWNHLYEESMLISSESPDADYFELAYSVLTVSKTTDLEQMSPRQRSLLRHAIRQFFSGQRADGTWPRSRPLFLYKKFGPAYCYDYELLVQLLAERPLRPLAMPYLDKLTNAARALEPKKFPLAAGKGFGWSSEHHGGEHVAESWSTASVFHFCFELCDLAYEAIRLNLFEYVDKEYENPRFNTPVADPFDGFLDSSFTFRNTEFGFKDVFENEFLKPLLKERHLVEEGREFEQARVSVILYGPPGTSKTDLATRVAMALGWQLLSLDPSHLTRQGLDNVHAETDALFKRLLLCDQIVVLMDEFDELVREREGKSELRSRFLTTAMLPKIAGLHDRRRIVYIVGTNHVEQFDSAISRQGRFDLILPVMPPTTGEKLKEWDALRWARDFLLANDESKDVIDEAIGDLTYGESKDLDARLSRLRERHMGGDPPEEEVRQALQYAVDNATLNKPADPESEGGPTWKKRLEEQGESKIQGLKV